MCIALIGDVNWPENTAGGAFQPLLVSQDFHRVDRRRPPRRNQVAANAAPNRIVAENPQAAGSNWETPSSSERNA
jgi:hypothetical protein